MPALMPTDYTGTIQWLGVNLDRDDTLRNQPRDRVFAAFGGVAEESRSGLTRPSDSRVVAQYPKGTEIRNTRQFSIVSAEEMAEIAGKMGLGNFDPAWIGASIVIEGIPDLSHLPPSSRLQTPAGTTLTVDMQNRPCHLPAAIIDEDRAGAGRAFKAAAKGLRGVTAWTEREGYLKVGDPIRLHIPDQRPWSLQANILTG